MALLLQKGVLPMWPEMHAGHGLLMNDAIVFHNMAVEIAQRIREVGWSEWKIYPQGASANVGLLSLLYALFNTDPAWFIPFNAAAHATGALLIYRLGSRLVSGDVGLAGGLITGIFFVICPSALQWYGQNHKDAFAIAGLLMVLDAWLKLHDDKFDNRLRGNFRVFLELLIGTLILGLVRPYFVMVMTLGFSVSFLLASFWCAKIHLVITRLGFILTLVFLTAFFGRYGNADVVVESNSSSLNLGAYQPASGEFFWKESDTLPAILDKTLRRASELRAHFVYFGRSVSAGSEIDGDHLPNTAGSALIYMPRALFIGLFAPFPDTWSQRVTLPRLIGALETACWYLTFLGVIFTVFRFRSRKLLAGIVFCAVVITMLAYIHPNVGTLYRQRFGLWHFFMLLGSIGWVSFFIDRLGLQRLSGSVISIDHKMSPPRSIRLTSREGMSGQGFVVILITLASYLGFFARDLFVTGQLGLGGELDAFFVASLIPMFFVTCLALPITDALVLPFTSAKNNSLKETEQLLRQTLSLALLVLLAATCFVFLSTPWLVSLLLQKETEETQSLAITLVRLFTPIIMLSAFTVVGNTALNCLRRPRTSALGQLTVPAITLMVLVLAPGEHIISASIGGMLLGALVNTLIVFRQLQVSGLLLLPGRITFVLTRKIWRFYWPLLGAAILAAAIIPMNYAFAASVSVGMAATWTFASKIVILFSGLASVGATAVFLPRLADLIYRGDFDVQRDANLFIALAIWLGGVFMLVGFIFAEPVVSIMLGNDLSLGEIKDLALIVQIGLMQIPVAIVSVLANKLAISAERSSRIIYSSALAFAINFLLNFLLVPEVGVLGVAIGALLSTTISVSVILVASYRQIGLSFVDIVAFLACLAAWIIICFGLLLESSATLMVGIIVLPLIARLQWINIQKSIFISKKYQKT
jgi:putative peptidoglycan lipid II flippase